MEKQNLRYLSSLALFTELYNNQKDIYSVLGEFLKHVVFTRGIHNFDSRQATDVFNETYNFSVPEAVIKKVLNKSDYIDRNDNSYAVADGLKFSDYNGGFSDKYETVKANNDFVIESFIKYIKDKRPNISKEDINNFINQFCVYLLDSGAYEDPDDLISGFIIKNKNTPDFTNRLNIIREGVILYSGIKYTSDINELGSWKTKLDIYLETEILFSAFGYNGELDKIIFNDLFNLIGEINRIRLVRRQDELVKLKYFEETKDEIDSFFGAAESILRTGEKIDPSKPAMAEVLNGCITPSDVIAKKSKFFEFLRSHGIKLDETDRSFYETENHIYSIEDPKFVESFAKEDPTLDVDDIERELKILNYINILRKGDNKGPFEGIKFILLTGKKLTKNIGIKNIDIERGDVPLSTSINWLTDRFWFKLNKGFGDEKLPRAFDVITKAQIVLSSHLKEKVSFKFKRLKDDFSSGKLSHDEVVSTLSSLKQSPVKPEDINESNIDNVLNEISEDEVDHYSREHNLLKQETKDQLGIIHKQNEQISELLPYKIRHDRNAKIAKLLVFSFCLLAFIALTIYFIYLFCCNETFYRWVGGALSIVPIFASLKLLPKIKNIYTNLVKK